MDVQKFPLEGFIHLKEVSVAWGAAELNGNFRKTQKGLRVSSEPFDSGEDFGCGSLNPRRLVRSGRVVDTPLRLQL